MEEESLIREEERRENGLKIQDPNECPFLRKNVFFIMVDLSSTKNFF